MLSVSTSIFYSSNNFTIFLFNFFKILTIVNNHHLYLQISTFSNSKMNTPTDNDCGFPLFEDSNFTCWLVSFKAHLRETGFHVVLDRPHVGNVEVDGDIEREILTCGSARV